MAAARAAKLAKVRTERDALRPRAEKAAAAATEGRAADLAEGQTEHNALRRRAKEAEAAAAEAPELQEEAEAAAAKGRAAAEGNTLRLATSRQGEREVGRSATRCGVAPRRGDDSGGRGGP